jgi:hypothetical protein
VQSTAAGNEIDKPVNTVSTKPSKAKVIKAA